MNKSKNHALRIAGTTQTLLPTCQETFVVGQMADSASETREERVKRLYASGGGPLLGWLFDECRARAMTMKALAAELGVTYGYVNQLRCGVREVHQVSGQFARRAARFLGVPPIVVKLLAGQLSVSDFIPAQQSEEEFVERALCRMMRDPKAGMLVSLEILSAELAVQKDFLSLYAEVSGDDVFNMRGLPETVRWLQRATIVHAENTEPSSISEKEPVKRQCVA